MSPERRPSLPAGFTLVEVLVSLAIFALAAVVLGTAYVNVLVNYQAMRAWSAEKEEIAFARAALLVEPRLPRAERGGQMALTEGGALRWSAEIAETTCADLFRVTLNFEISPAGQKPARREREVFLLLRPTWSDPIRREQLRTLSRERLARRHF